MIDAVLTHHLQVDTCGVAKFSAELAQRLGVPFGSWREAGKYQHPLLSLKPAEMDASDLAMLPTRDMATFDLFLHGEPGAWPLVRAASRVLVSSEATARQVRGTRDDVLSAWCPPLLRERTVSFLGGNTVFSMGMAHKFPREMHRMLAERLAAAGGAYTVAVSAAVHAGDPLARLFEVRAAVEDVYGEHGLFVGTLSDEAASIFMRACRFTAMFFPGGVCEHNSTAMAAMASGACLITNIGPNSPPTIRHGVHVLDICEDWAVPSRLARTTVGGDARLLVEERYGWDGLVGMVRG